MRPPPLFGSGTGISPVQRPLTRTFRSDPIRSDGAATGKLRIGQLRTAQAEDELDFAHGCPQLLGDLGSGKALVGQRKNLGLVAR